MSFVGADLKAVTQKAAYTMLRHNITTKISNLEQLELPENLKITQADFLSALK